MLQDEQVLTDFLFLFQNIYILPRYMCVIIMKSNNKNNY